MSIGTRGIHAAQFDIPSLLQNKANTRLCLSPEKKKEGGGGGRQFSLAKAGNRNRIMSKQYF